MMENGFFSVPIDMAARDSVGIDGIVSETTSNSLVQNQFDSFELNNQNQTLAGYSMLPTLQEPIHNLQGGGHIATRPVIMNFNAVVTSFGRGVVRDALPGSSHPIANPVFQGQFVGGTPVSSTALATRLDTRSGDEENLNNIAPSGSSIYASTDGADALNTAVVSFVNYSCDEVYGTMNGKEDLNRLPALVGPGGKTPMRAGFLPCLAAENHEPNRWVSSNSVNVSSDNPFESHKFSNALSLSLATCQPSVINGSSLPDQSSEISCSGALRRCLKETRLGSEQTSCSSKDLSLSWDSHRADHFSRVVSGSRYLHAIQEILAQIASYSLENLDVMSISTGGIKTGANVTFSSSCGMLQSGSDESPPNADGRFEVQMDPALQKKALEAKKTQLLTLLQLVDERYNQCLDEIHTVISAFHAATELEPQIHTRFALQTISILYKSLRERISNQILAMGAHGESGCAREVEGTSEASYLEKQWTLLQLKKKDQQLWRPQRGLPERSVSVLRAWMFQNFLHPYPKDAEKHLLAVKSGLTRSQVSNWFINARVRLWKPMIEEMYAEMNRRKARGNEEGTNSHKRGHISISNQRFDVNLS